MNKKYQSPALEVLSFDKEDIVTASDPNALADVIADASEDGLAWW